MKAESVWFLACKGISVPPAIWAWFVTGRVAVGIWCISLSLAKYFSLAFIFSSLIFTSLDCLLLFSVPMGSESVAFSSLDGR